MKKLILLCVITLVSTGIFASTYENYGYFYGSDKTVSGYPYINIYPGDVNIELEADAVLTSTGGDIVSFVAVTGPGLGGLVQLTAVAQPHDKTDYKKDDFDRTAESGSHQRHYVIYGIYGAYGYGRTKVVISY